MSLTSPDELRRAPNAEVLALYAAIIDELLARKVVRSMNNPVADYAEWLVARAFDLELVRQANAGHDAIDRDGVRYEIKARRLHARNAARQLSFFRGFGSPESLSADPFEYLVAILFDAHFGIYRAARMPVAAARRHALWSAHVSGWRLVLNDVAWTWPDVEDVTDRIAAAAQQLAETLVLPIVEPA